MSTKFTFRDKEHVLEDILEDGDLFDLKNNYEQVTGKIITRTGITSLQEKLGDIDFEIGPIQHFTFNKQDVIAIEVAAFDLLAKDGPAGRDFGEASVSNCQGIAEQYPVAMAIKRGKYRALADLLNLRGVYSQDEAKEMTDQVNSQRKSRKSDAKETPATEKVDGKKVVGEINRLVEDLGITAEEKLNIYREVLGDADLSVAQIKSQATPGVKIKVLDILKNKK